MRELAERADINRGTFYIHYRDVGDLLQRLEDKGAVSSREEGRKKVFSPVLRREDAALQETEDFLTRVYNGSVSLLVSSMTRRQALPQEEIDQLYALLQQLEDQKGAD